MCCGIFPTYPLLLSLLLPITQFVIAIGFVWGPCSLPNRSLGFSRFSANNSWSSSKAHLIRVSIAFPKSQPLNSLLPLRIVSPSLFLFPI